MEDDPKVKIQLSIQNHKRLLEIDVDVRYDNRLCQLPRLRWPVAAPAAPALTLATLVNAKIPALPQIMAEIHGGLKHLALSVDMQSLRYSAGGQK
jgi:hypothetical protein